MPKLDYSYPMLQEAQKIQARFSSERILLGGHLNKTNTNDIEGKAQKPQASNLEAAKSRLKNNDNMINAQLWKRKLFFAWDRINRLEAEGMATTTTTSTTTAAST